MTIETSKELWAYSPLSIPSVCNNDPSMCKRLLSPTPLVLFSYLKCKKLSPHSHKEDNSQSYFEVL